MLPYHQIRRSASTSAFAQQTSSSSLASVRRLGCSLTSAATAAAILVDQRRSCASAAAAAASESTTSAEAATAAAAAAAPPLKHPFLQHFDTFILSHVDYCAVLGEEANKKHGVPKNVPPQANPPTDRHQVVYCDALAKRALDPSSFAYPIIFESPPKSIPGMEIPRSPADLARTAQQSQPLPKPGSAAALAAAAARKPIDNGKFVNPLRDLMASMQSAEEMADPLHVGSLNAMTSSSSSSPSSSSTSANRRVLRFDIPTDEEIDTLLLDTWDAIGEQRTASSTGDLRAAANEFTPCGKFVVKTSDSSDAPATLQSSEKVLQSVDGSQSGRVGGAASPELRPHFRTPFTSDPTIAARAKPPSLSKHVERKFACGACDKAFRLLPALVNHYQTAHGARIPQSLLLKYKAVDNGSNAIAAQVNEFEKRRLEAEERKQALLEKLSKNGDVSAANDAATTVATSAAVSSPVGNILVGEAALRATPLPEVDITVHARSAANIQLVGHVRSVRCGYVKTSFVAELMVETVFTPPARRRASGSEDGNDEQEGEPPAVVDEERELHLVRCFGDDYAKLIAGQLSAAPQNSSARRVLVAGSLRMNRHFDKSTGKITAFPYVRVMAPMGTVQLL